MSLNPGILVGIGFFAVAIIIAVVGVIYVNRDRINNAITSGSSPLTPVQPVVVLPESDLATSLIKVGETYNALRKENAEQRTEIARLKSALTNLAASITEAVS